ncbi:MAG: IS66 family transposase [Gemmatales bacterium]
MDGMECPGCRQRDERIADLERRLAQLEGRLNRHAGNSSVPPSANPLGAKPPVVKKKSKRRRGGQAGHPPHLKQLLPPERVTRIEAIVPEICEHCQTPLSREPQPDDPEPKRFQTAELPPIAIEVVEYQAHARTCGCCGQRTQARVPASVRAHSVGPRLTATLSYFSGCHGVSKRCVEEIAETVLGLPIALGTVANLEQEVSDALAPAHREALEAVRQADVKFADETSWKLWGKLCWLWAGAAEGVAAFVIHARRGATGLAALLGESIGGIVHSDRWHVYLQIPEERRQLCWAHLKRDFRKIVECVGPSRFVGRRGLRIAAELFAAWHAFRAGIIPRQRLQELIAPLERRLGKTLLEGAFGDDARVAKFCQNLIELEPALWTFAKVEGVEPTNNFMERLVRLAVLWRRRSFGCNSAVGCRFVERILTVVQTCRLKKRSPLEYLVRAVTAHRSGTACPPLLAQG